MKDETQKKKKCFKNVRKKFNAEKFCGTSENVYFQNIDISVEVKGTFLFSFKILKKK